MVPDQLDVGPEHEELLRNPTPTLNTKKNPKFGVSVPNWPAKFNLDKNVIWTVIYIHRISSNSATVSNRPTPSKNRPLRGRLKNKPTVSIRPTPSNKQVSLTLYTCLSGEMVEKILAVKANMDKLYG